VRYYGLLSSRLKGRYKKRISKLLRKEVEREKLKGWRERQILFTGKDPLICPICGREMELVEFAFLSLFKNYSSSDAFKISIRIVVSMQIFNLPR